MRRQLGRLLLGWSEWLLTPEDAGGRPRRVGPPPLEPMAIGSWAPEHDGTTVLGAVSAPQPELAGDGPSSLSADPALAPALRAPLPIQQAVLNHDLRVLRREAADALAALGAAHALVSSARLAQVQTLRQHADEDESVDETLLTLAADYQGWTNDQVRLFDALSMVMRMRIPAGRVMEQVDPAMHPQASHHLEMLCLEYERQQLSQRFRQPAAEPDSAG